MTKTWLITGSARGLGRTIAEAVLESGDRVVAAARRPEALADLAARHPGRVHPVRMDVTDAAEVDAAVAEALAAVGAIDVLVNNAGSGEVAAFEDTSAAMFRAQIDVNFYGVVNVTRALLPHMRARRAGHIIQISAITGRFGVPGLAADTAAKFAVEGFSDVIAQEVAPLGIKLTLIEPGGLRTSWGHTASDMPPVSAPYEETVGALARIIRDNLGRESGDPARCAAVILKLADMAEPPLRLVLGADALREVMKRDRARSESDAAWRAVSKSIDFPDEALRPGEASPPAPHEGP